MRCCCLFALLGVAGALCPGQDLLVNPEDPGQPGPWPVSSFVLEDRPGIPGTITKRKLHLEIWFPGTIGAEKRPNATRYSYSCTAHLPANQAAKIPPCPPSDPHPSSPTCCEPQQFFNRTWKGLPLDTTHGPYPVIVFIHGTAAFREYFHHVAEHWSSRGFVVAAVDYPGITLADEIRKLELKLVPKTDQVGDTKLLIAELRSLQDERLAFLRGHIDMGQLGITGHSAGGFATGDLSRDGVPAKVFIPMAGKGTTKPPSNSGSGSGSGQASAAFSSLVLGGQNDTIVGGDQAAFFKSSPTPKRHLGVANAGHETYSDMCWLAPAQGGLSGVGASCGVPGSNLLEVLADQGCRFAKNDKHAAGMSAPDAGTFFCSFLSASRSRCDSSTQSNSLANRRPRLLSAHAHLANAQPRSLAHRSLRHGRRV